MRIVESLNPAPLQRPNPLWLSVSAVISIPGPKPFEWPIPSSATLSDHSQLHRISSRKVLEYSGDTSCFSL